MFKVGRNRLTGLNFTSEMPCGLGRLWRCRDRVVFVGVLKKPVVIPTLLPVTVFINCMKVMCIWKCFDWAVIRGSIARKMRIFKKIGFCLEPQNPPNWWVQSGLHLDYETTTSLEHRGTILLLQTIQRLNVVNFWRRRLMFWFFGSQKLPEMFCSRPVSHEGMLMLLTQIRDLKNLLEMFHFYRTPWFSKDPKCETDTNSKYTSNRMHLVNLRCAFAVHLFWAMWRVPRILAQQYVCLWYPSWFQT